MRYLVAYTICLTILLPLHVHVSGQAQEPCDPGVPSTCVNGNCINSTCECSPGFGMSACDVPLSAIDCGPIARGMAGGNSLCSNTSNAYNTSCAFSCFPGYSLSGSLLRVCTSLGAWTGTPPSCSPVCSSPCINGTCVGPDTCACNVGYNATQEDPTLCLPQCSPPCLNGGVCTAPSTCSCPEGTIQPQCAQQEGDSSLRDRLTDASQPFNPSSYKFYVTWGLIAAAALCAVGLLRHHRKKKIRAMDGGAGAGGGGGGNKIAPAAAEYTPYPPGVAGGGPGDVEMGGHHGLGRQATGLTPGAPITRQPTMGPGGVGGGVGGGGGGHGGMPVGQRQGPPQTTNTLWG